ncbi:MAG TPA: HlyD family efflux transporter periplasmic adaptor subunit [Polyangiaceae bacterium]|nr:HlyD family efflux transporter periplasmic adaptor subunit [Polyangiaceae bacterium]
MSGRRSSLGAAVLRCLFGAAVLGLLGCASHDDAPSWFTIRKGDLLLGVEVVGELEAVQSDSLGPPLVSGVGEFKIARMAPEGIALTKGQPALGFDTSELTRKLEEKQNEEAAVAAEIGKKQADAALSRRNEELNIAEAEGKLRKAELKASRSEDLTGSLELALARLDFRLAEKELAYHRAKAAATRRQDRQDLEALRFREQAARDRVSEIQAALPQLQVAAPRDGTVIYISNWNNQKKKVGDAVWRGEKVLQTAALDQMRARGEIDEVDVSKLAVGQRVMLRLEAYPDVEYAGSVKGIARLVERKSPDNPRRIVRTEIDLDHTEPLRMRPGMRFRATAETERITQALLIPMSAIFLTERGPVAYRQRGVSVEPVPLTLGRSNSEYAEVLAGLSEGDQVARGDRSVDEGEQSERP